MIFKAKNNPDVLKTIAFTNKRPKVVIGFAAETENLIENAREKLKTKNVDIIIANQIDSHNEVFGSNFNKISFVEKNKLVSYDRKTKQEISEILVNKIINNFIWF